MLNHTVFCYFWFGAHGSLPSNMDNGMTLLGAQLPVTIFANLKTILPVLEASATISSAPDLLRLISSQMLDIKLQHHWRCIFGPTTATTPCNVPWIPSWNINLENPTIGPNVLLGSPAPLFWKHELVKSSNTIIPIHLLWSCVSYVSLPNYLPICKYCGGHLLPTAAPNCQLTKIPLSHPSLIHTGHLLRWTRYLISYVLSQANYLWLKEEVHFKSNAHGTYHVI